MRLTKLRFSSKAVDRVSGAAAKLVSAMNKAVGEFDVSGGR